MNNKKGNPIVSIIIFAFIFISMFPVSLVFIIPFLIIYGIVVSSKKKTLNNETQKELTRSREKVATVIRNKAEKEKMIDHIVDKQRDKFEDYSKYNKECFESEKSSVVDKTKKKINLFNEPNWDDERDSGLY